MVGKKQEYKEILASLVEFRNLVKYYSAYVYDDYGPDLSETRQKINHKISKIKHYLKKANISTEKTVRAPTAMGGGIFNQDMLDDMFNNEGTPMAIDLRGVLDLLDRAIGFYEELIESGKSIPELTGRQPLDIYRFIELKLRPMFREEPKDEEEVQDKIEDILNVSNVDYKREKESFTYSTKSYIPDFTLFESQIALEVKLCNSKKDEKKIIDEINTDISAYKTKYRICFFVIYDVGIIRNVQAFKQGFEQHDKVYIVVVKH